MKTGWETAKIGEACLLMTGGTPSRNKPEYFGGEIKWLVSGDIHQGEIFECEGRITELGLCNSNARILPIDSVMIALNGQGKTRGTVALLRTQATCNQSLVSITPKDANRLLPEFLYANLKGRYQEIRRLTGDDGNDRRGLNMPLIRGIEIPIPPLSEQKRILTILDQAFEAIAAARINTEKNRKNVCTLSESYQQEIFIQRNDGWVEKALGEMATFRNGVNFTKSSKGESIKILGVKDFKNHYWARLDSLESIIPDGALPEADTLQQNDIVFVRSNGNPELIGRCLLIGEIDERTTFSGFTIRARQSTKEILPQYLCHFLKLSHVRRELVEGGNGANIRSLNQGTLSRLRINFPTEISEQYRIIKQLEAIQAETKRLESLYQRKIDALDELKQSLLHQAFSGKL
ncbi:restriction endonuclease subunit S [Enterobacter kobei]